MSARDQKDLVERLHHVDGLAAIGRRLQLDRVGAGRNRGEGQPRSGAVPDKAIGVTGNILVPQRGRGVVEADDAAADETIGATRS